MKKIFTLLFSLCCVVAAMAQTPAQEIGSTTFTGSGKVKISSKDYTFASQSAVFTTNATDSECSDIQLSSGSFKYTVITITLEPELAEGIKVTKNNDKYTLDTTKSFRVKLGNGYAYSYADANFKNSSIDVVNGKATMVVHLTNLSQKISSVVGDYLDATYTFTAMPEHKADEVSGLNVISTGNEADGKFFQQGRLMIRKNGVVYGANGAKM